jgi:D-sedoheptulose 7-phosphate isomerase
LKSIISLTGPFSDELADFSDAILSVKTAKTTRIQEIHAIAGHIMCECVEETLFGN